MNLRLIPLVFMVFVTPVLAHEVAGEPVPPATNKDGSTVTGVLTAQFDPSNSAVPIPTNLFYLGTGDLTLNAPISDPDSTEGVLLSNLNALDGYSITEKWVAAFVDDNVQAANIDPASVIPGATVRVFEVTSSGFVYVTGIIRELTPGVDFVAVAQGGSVAVVPLKPLREYTNYMAVLTNDIKDVMGNNATADRTYYLSQSDTPWVDENGNSTYALFDDATAQLLELFRGITATMEGAAESAGIPHEDIILAWTVQTQSIRPTLSALRSIVVPMPVLSAPTPFNTADVGGFGLAEITMGVISLPYYSGVPSEENPVAPLTDFWTAPPGGYIPPYDQFGLDPTSTNLTFANPFPVPTDVQTVPFLITYPSATSGISKPENGWPVVIYIHGITRNRTDMLRIADSMAAAGQAFIAIDQPLHGVVPDVAPELAPFYIENTPFGAIANERTFDADYWNNTTGALGPDGIMDASGSSYFNVANFRAVRDNLRQAQTDYSTLAVSLQNIDVDGDTIPDLDPTNISALAHSLGVYTAVPFLSVEPLVKRAYFNAGGAQALRTILAGSFGDRINAALAGLGIFPGSALYEQFVIVGQTVLDSPDPAGWASMLAEKMPIIHNEVIGDEVVPNVVPGAPMGGNEGLNALMSLQSYSTTQVDLEGLQGVARFVVGDHSSLLEPVNPQVTAEMQGQAASFFASGGVLVNVGNPNLLLPVVELNQLIVDEPGSGKRNDKIKSKRRKGPVFNPGVERLRDPIE